MKELKIDYQLDSNLRQLKIDGESTNIELATDKIRISENATFTKDLTIEGDLKIEGSTGDINMTDGTKITSTSVPGQFSFTGTAIAIYGITYTGDGDDDDNEVALALLPATGNDAKTLLYDGSTIKWAIGNDSDDSHKLKFDSGTATIGASTALTIEQDGDLITTGDVTLAAAKKLYLDGGTDTYLFEHSADHVRLVVGDDALVRFTESGDDGNEVFFSDASVGFTQLEPTYNATTTEVDFRKSNKQNLTFGAGNITNLQLFFPNMSGNFQLLIKQDGTGSRTITNYRAYEFDESAADGEAAVKFAGGSNPTLTTDANHVDILSFYWDNDNEIAYGVATLDFQF